MADRPGGSENLPGKDFVDDEEDVSEEMKRLDAEEAEKARLVTEHLTRQLNDHFSKLGGDFKSVFDQRMETIASHCQNQVSETVSSRQSDVLKTNKVFREISRPLGAKWKNMFEFLTADLPVERVRIEMDKLEREKPFMQPYKSLMAWKELKGEEFDVRDLIPALQLLGLEVLAEKALDILNCDSTEALIDMSCVGKPRDAGAPSSAAVGPDRAAGTSAIGACAITSAVGSTTASTSILSPSVNAQDVLDDRHLLQLAKKLGGSWETLARALSISTEEIAEILESEGGSYQGAFKMLWNWRETNTDLRPALQQLMDVLRRFKRHDLESILC